MTRTDRCQACGHEGMRPFFEVAEIPIHSCLLMRTREQALDIARRDLELGFCPACGFVQNLVFDAAVHSYSPEYEETQAFSETFNSFARQLVEGYVERYDIRDKRILEIGCGKGEFLVRMCEAGGNRGLGIDPGYRPERTTTEADVRFLNEFYDESHGSYEADVILCRHTLEHIQPVRELVRTVRRSIGDRRDVVVLFELPAVERILEDQAFEDVYYEHCSYFSLGSLARLFRASGFEVTHLSKAYDDQYLLIDAVPADGPTRARLPEEDDLELLTDLVEAYRTEAPRKVAGWRDDCERAAGAGRRTVLWGGGSKAVSFLTTCGIGAEVDRVVDINPHKHGKFLPGTGHPVVAPRDLRDAPPDRVIVMNPIYVDEIRKDLEAMGLAPQILTP
ncbi:MAG: methyltransferase domain-containing protein [Planctomycetota bacterium]